MIRIPLLSSLFLLVCWVPAGASVASWVPFDLRADREPAVAQRWAEAGIGALTWSTAVADVSAFDGVDFVPVAALTARLTAEDPRWDPWLRSLEPLFHPAEGEARAWVPAAEAARAAALVSAEDRLPGRQAPVASPARAPRTILGWGLVGLAGFYLVLWGLARLRAPSPPGWGAGFGALVLVVLGVFCIVLAPGDPGTRGPSDPGVSWVRHRWFQEAWPYGARFADAGAGRPWTYPRYQQVGGRTVEVPGTVPTLGEGWENRAFGALPPTHPARLFGPGNP